MIKKPKKWFGQNFLIDDNIIEQIIDFVAPQKTDHFVEIGPGHGALTIRLAPLVFSFDAIEIDRDLAEPLQKLKEKDKQLNIIIEDALNIDLKTLVKNNEKLRIIGNLPYHLATTLLFCWCTELEIIKDIHVMVQKEVAERLIAEPGNHTYGRLSIMANLYYQIELLFDVQPDSFYPKPKVKSSVIRLTPRATKLCKLKDQSLFEKVVQIAFMHRRKTLKNALKKIISASDLQSLNIDPSLRPEQLAIEQYVAISNFLASHINRDHLNQ